MSGMVMMGLDEATAKMYALYGENRKITDGNYDRSLGVKSPDGKAKEWPLYDLTDKYVMVFDEFDIRAEKESAMSIVDWDRTYFMTRYYVR